MPVQLTTTGSANHGEGFCHRVHERCVSAFGSRTKRSGDRTLPSECDRRGLTLESLPARYAARTRSKGRWVSVPSGCVTSFEVAGDSGTSVSSSAARARRISNAEAKPVVAATNDDPRRAAPFREPRVERTARRGARSPTTRGWRRPPAACCACARHRSTRRFARVPPS